MVRTANCGGGDAKVEHPPPHHQPRCRLCLAQEIAEVSVFSTLVARRRAEPGHRLILRWGLFAAGGFLCATPFCRFQGCRDWRFHQLFSTEQLWSFLRLAHSIRPLPIYQCSYNKKTDDDGA